MPTGASLIADGKAKTAGTQSSYGCYLTTLTTDIDLPYTFWSVYLHYPEQIVSDAGDAKALYKNRLKNDGGKIYLLANCVIPATNEAASLVDELLRDSIREYEKPPSTGKTSDALITSNSQDWCSLPNSEGYSCMEGTCWHSIDMNTCCGPDGCGLPEVEVVSEIDDCTDCGEGGGGPLPPPDDPDDPWLPPPNGGGGGGVCTTCNPGDNPDDDEETCPLGEIADGNGGCIGEEEHCEIQDLLSSCSIDDENFIDCIKNSVSSYLQQHAEASMPGIYTEMKNAGLTTAQAAYVIATAQHESHFGRFMNEIDPDIDFYQSRTDLGNTQSGDGAKYIGRGYVQLTGRANYQYWGDRLGIDLINNPELAEDPVIAARILVYGMRDGTFTGRKLSAHINENETDYINARWIVNGQDRAEDIATIAENFENAIINCTN